MVSYLIKRSVRSYTRRMALPALQGVRKGNLFIADLQSGSKDEVNYFYAKASSDESWLWHKRLSHLNFKTMNSLVKRELVRGLPQMEFTQEGLCEACQKEKSKKASHKSTDTSAKLKVTSYGLIWSSECDVYVKEEICSCNCR